MRWLQGDLDVLPFSDFVSPLIENRAFGTLKVMRPPDQKILALAEDGLRLISTTTRSANSLGEILLRTGKVSREQLNLLLAEQKRSGVKLSELIRQRDLITQTDLLKALREQAEEEIYDLFLWESGSFEFVEGPPPEGTPRSALSGAVVASNPTSIILEAARRADELQVIMKVIRDESLVPVKTTQPFKPDALGMDQDIVRSVYAAIDGRRTVDEVARASLYPRYAALRALYLLTTRHNLKLLNDKGATAIIQRQSSTRRRVARDVPVQKPRPDSRGTLVLLGELVTYRNALAALLRSAGYDVVEEAAAGAVSLLSRERRIHGVILDIGLDNPSGYDFCTWLSENFRAPIIILSADPSEEASRNALAAGARSYVIKPFARETILKTVFDTLVAAGHRVIPAPK